MRRVALRRSHFGAALLSGTLVAAACGEVPPGGATSKPMSGGGHDAGRQSEALRRHQWAEMRSREARSRQLRMLEAADPSGARRARSIVRERYAFRRHHRLSRGERDRLVAEGTAADWDQSEYCQVDPDTVYRVCAHALAPVALTRITGRYTSAMCRAKAEGVVILELIVGPQGVRRAKVLRGVSPELDGEALRAARRTKWLPALVCGRPATVAYTIAVPFSLPSDCR